MEVDITGLPKYAVLAALWNAAHAHSVFDRKPCMSETRAREVADWLMQSKLPGDRLDWLDSRSMKVDIRGDSFDATLYDRDNGGEGAAAKIISTLRHNMKVPEHGNQQKVSKMDPGSPGEVHGDSPSQEQQQEQEVLPTGGVDRAGPGGGEGSTGSQSA